MAKVAFLGSSYIARLDKFCCSDMKIPGQTQFFGVPGLRADSVPPSKIQEITVFNPDIICVLVGGNDISDTSSPSEIFKNIVNLVDVLKNVCMIYQIYVCEVLSRGKFKFSKHMTYERFEAQRTKINKKLIIMKNASIIPLRKIKYPQDYVSDCVHLNDGGQKKLFFALRTAILTTKLTGQ